MSKEIEELAKELHYFYEERSIVNNWNTQKSCKVNFDALPKENKQTMLDLASLVKSKLSELERENKELKGDIESIKLQSKAMQNDLNDSIQNLLAKNDKLMGKEYSMENFIKEKGLKFEYNKAQLLRSYFKIN